MNWSWQIGTFNAFDGGLVGVSNKGGGSLATTMTLVMSRCKRTRHV